MDQSKCVSNQVADRLDALRQAYQDCQRCALASSRSRVVFGHGRPRAPLFLLAERIGETDEQTGRPFSPKFPSKSGQNQHVNSYLSML